MSVVVTGSTGNIGRPLTDRLLDAGLNVVLLVRDPSRVADFAARGARPVQGDLTDQVFVVEASRGAETLFWLTPPSYGADNIRSFYAGLGRIAAAAIAENEIPRVVHLSSVGAHVSAGTGVVLGLHDNEQTLDATDASVTHLRPGYFMENFLNHVGSMKTAGSVFLPLSAGARTPMIATRDISEVAAEIIFDPSWSGRRVAELHGPADLSFGQVVGTLTDVLETPIGLVTITGAEAVEAMVGMGLGRSFAEGIAELDAAIETGLMVTEQPRSAQTTTTTTFEEFAREIIKPVFDGLG